MGIPPEPDHVATTWNEHLARTCGPWPFRWAVALACVTFPLIWVGGLVTSYDAGMSVPDWPTTFGYNLFAYPWKSWFFGPWDLFVEHGHRLMASLAGLLSLGLAVVCTRQSPRVRLASWLAVFLVISQGVLGGLRVLYNSRELAQIHAIVAPLFFVFTLCLVLWTYRESYSSLVTRPASGQFLALAWGLAALVLLQLVLGSFLRHTEGQYSPPRFRMLALWHMINAAVVCVVFPCTWGFARRWQLPQTARALAAAGCLLVTLQFVLGTLTWVAKFGWPSNVLPMSPVPGWTVQAEGFLQSVSATAHVAVGALLLGISVLIGLTASHRSSTRASRHLPVSGSVHPGDRDAAATRYSVRELVS